MRRKRKIMIRVCFFIIAVLLVIAIAAGTLLILEKRGRAAIASGDADITSEEIQDPHLIFWTDSSDLDLNATTELTMHVAIPADWFTNESPASLEILNGEETAAVYPLDTLEPEADMTIGNVPYHCYSGILSVDDSDEDDSYTALPICAKWGQTTSETMNLYRDITVTDEMMETCCDVLDEINDLVETMGTQTNDGIAFSEDNSPEDVLEQVLTYLEASDQVSWASLETDSIIRFTTVDGVSSFFSMERVYEDEDLNTCGSGIPSSLDDISGYFSYNKNYRATAVKGDVMVSCPVDNSYSDRLGSSSQSAGKSLAAYLDSTYTLISGKDSISQGLISIHNGSWTNYGTVMQITHSSSLPRADGSTYLMYVIASSHSEKDSWSAYERLRDSWQSSDKLNDTEGDPKQNCFLEISYNQLANRSDMRLAYGLNKTYIFNDDTLGWHLLPTNHYDIDISSDYMMYIYNGLRFENTLFYLGSCESIQDTRFNQFLYDHGASSVVGYPNIANTSMEQSLCKAFFESLITDNMDLPLVYRTNNLAEAEEKGHTLVSDALAVTSSALGGSTGLSIYCNDTFVYHGEGVLCGKVQNDKEKPLEGAVVIAYRYFNSMLSEEARATTDGNGKYQFDNLTWGMYLFQVYYRDEGEVIRNFSFKDMIYENLDFIIATKKHLTGSVRDLTLGTAIEGASVTVDDGTRQTVLTTDAGGIFEGDFEAGSYTITAQKTGYKDSDPYPFIISEDDEEVVILDDILLEKTCDYYEFIRDSLLPTMGYASLLDASRTVTTQTFQSSLAWDQRFGLIGADIADLNNDGTDDLLVYYLTANTEQTYAYEVTGRYPMILCADLYTIENNEIVQVASVPITSSFQTTYDYIRLGLMEVDDRTFLYVENISMAYFADGFYAGYQWYEYGDGGAFLPRWDVCKSDGGSSDIAFSLYTCTAGLDRAYEAENYEKTVIWADGAFLQYNDEVTPLISGNCTYAEASLRGFEEMGNIPVTTLYGASLYSDRMPTYWSEEYLKPSISYTCEGTGSYSSRNITVSVSDLTQLQAHIEALDS